MQYDIVIIGGGVVGLATAYKLKETKPELSIALLEKENELAKHQTGNNSGVIHSGIYYKPGSLKAKNCINGYKLLLDFCDREKILYELCGKIIVATREDELERLEALYERGLQNGLTEIKKISAAEIKEYEPHANGIAGIWVPYTGIIDYKDVCEKYAELFTNKYKGDIFLNQKVIDIKPNTGNCTIITKDKTFNAKLVINTAGLHSDQIALLTRKIDVRIIPFRGEYYEVKKEKHNLVKNLIYPVPDPAFPFLGVHFTRRLKGGIEAGPNAVFAFKKEGYKKTDINLKEMSSALSWPGFQKVMWKYWQMGMGEYYRSFNKSAFTKALQRLLPDINKADLIPGGAGVRAQACTRDGALIDDFLIYEDPQIINVLNAPSPAATASLSIGTTISEMAISRFS
ncbi:MAG: L-2-hydroxyglutarate oxidase [Bacteroidota bacterium]|nr:L-2-hydroxyglutarate oxidase [Bacteroidota bacterium]